MGSGGEPNLAQMLGVTTRTLIHETPILKPAGSQADRGQQRSGIREHFQSNFAPVLSVTCISIGDRYANLPKLGVPEVF